VSAISGVLFVALLGGLHLLEPEFDPRWRFISEYALGGYGWMMRLAFLALAASLLTAAVAIWSQVRTGSRAGTRLGYIGLFALGLAALGLLISAVFTTDPVTTSRGAAETLHGKLHVFGGSLDYTPIAALLLSFSLARNQAWRPMRKWLFITAGITLAATAAFMFNLPYDGTVGPDVRAGLFGRFLLVSYLGWLLTIALHVRRLHRQFSVDSGCDRRS
jgi:hypothetical protein